MSWVLGAGMWSVSLRQREGESKEDFNQRQWEANNANRKSIMDRANKWKAEQAAKNKPNVTPTEEQS